jgi:CheY-like chemotaxis protein
MTGLHVLVVEDCIDTATTMAMLLRMHGHQVEIAQDGPSAIDRARQDKPDVVLLDIGLPGMSGYEVTPHLRECLRDKPPLIIAVTGYAQESDCRRSAEAGIDLHLVKPVDPLDLIHILSRFAQVVAEGQALSSARQCSSPEPLTRGPGCRQP